MWHIEKEKNAFGDDKLYEKLVKGNTIVDYLAKQAIEADFLPLKTRNSQKERDWRYHPTPGTDTF